MKIDIGEIEAKCIECSISDFARRWEDYCKIHLRKNNVDEFNEGFEGYQCYVKAAEKHLGENSYITKELKRTQKKLETSVKNLNLNKNKSNVQ